ncbi:hypothetical protein MNBD_CHLOROFLEXI01-271 [hydrothermal vent metagenome]|uniref:Uncharacterized protein n=1 Tax=hydrothermal vent metagenome TaxID=652676 RepID=A0A3B0V8V4_9ZZZZ
MMNEVLFCERKIDNYPLCVIHYPFSLPLAALLCQHRLAQDLGTYREG